MGGVEELVSFAERMITPPFDRSEDDNTNWADIARQECEVRWTEIKMASIIICVGYTQEVDGCETMYLVDSGLPLLALQHCRTLHLF